MAIEFEKEAPKKTKLSTCSVHQLKYDSAITWGCVLCKKGQTKRISGYLVLGGLLILGAVGFLLAQMLDQDARGSKNRPTIHVARPAQTAGDTPKEPAVEEKCLLQIGEQVEDCLAKIDGADEHAKMDREMCMDVVATIDDACPDAYTSEKSINEPIYSLGSAPAWADVRAPIEAAQDIIEKCMESMTYKFGLRLTVEGHPDSQPDIILSNFGLDTKKRFCVYELLKSLSYPATTGGEYTVVSFLDSDVLSLNKVIPEDKRKEEFNKFLQEQRSQAEGLQAREAVRAAQEERNRQIQEEIKNSR